MPIIALPSWLSLWLTIADGGRFGDGLALSLDFQSSHLSPWAPMKTRGSMTPKWSASQFSGLGSGTNGPAGFAAVAMPIQSSLPKARLDIDAKYIWYLGPILMTSGLHVRASAVHLGTARMAGTGGGKWSGSKEKATMTG